MGEDDQQRRDTTTVPADTRVPVPDWLREVNAKVLAGEFGPDFDVLCVVGRRSGLPRLTPVTPVEIAGASYVVGGFPGADWVRNARAAGVGTWRVGEMERSVRLVEVGPDEARPVLRALPSTSPSGAEVMRDAGVVDDVTAEAFEGLTGRCPVFRLDVVA